MVAAGAEGRHASGGAAHGTPGAARASARCRARASSQPGRPGGHLWRRRPLQLLRGPPSVSPRGLKDLSGQRWSDERESVSHESRERRDRSRHDCRWSCARWRCGVGARWSSLCAFFTTVPHLRTTARSTHRRVCLRRSTPPPALRRAARPVRFRLRPRRPGRAPSRSATRASPLVEERGRGVPDTVSARRALGERQRAYISAAPPTWSLPCGR